MTTNKGAVRERELANWLWELGFAVVRAPASGGGVRRRFAPDIVAIRGGRVLVLEVKYRARPTTIPMDCDRVARLVEFARRAGGEAHVAVKYARESWRIMPIEPLASMCSDGAQSASISPDQVRQSMTLEDYVRGILNMDIMRFSQ